ncbi:MAG: hypothetical protein ACLQVY_02135 [Limisphaerales bacterium]
MNFERTFLFWLLALICLAPEARGAPANPLPIAARYHFAGGERVASGTNLATFNRIAALRTTAAFQNLALDEASAAAVRGIGLEGRASAKVLLKPLLADLLHAESLGAFARASSNVPDFVLALRLDAARAGFWHENLAQLFGGPGEKITAEGYSGWRWNTATGPGLPTNSDSFWIVPARDWLLVGRGDDFLAMQAEYLQGISRQGSPGSALNDSLMEAEVDLSQLASWLPEGARLFKPARVKLTVTAKADHFHINAQAVYPEAVPWASRPWQIPTELVRNPLISFTAGEDVAAFLDLGPSFERIDHNPLTNQFCAWALGDMVFQSYMAWPVPNASNAVQALSAEAAPAFDPYLKRLNHGKIVWSPEKGRLVLSNLGVVAPSLEAAPVQQGQYLFLSLFPLASASKPAPVELWKEIEGHHDLVCYDWEATGPRLQQWRLLSGILWHSSPVGDDETTETAKLKEDWLNAIGSPKGNAVTVITRTAPNELSLVRTAPLGLTGIELIVLSDWISHSKPH